MTHAAGPTPGEILAGSSALDSLRAAEAYGGVVAGIDNTPVHHPIPDLAELVAQASANAAHKADAEVSRSVEHGRAGAMCLRALGLALDISANAANQQPGETIFIPGETSLKSLATKHARTTHTAGSFLTEQIHATDKPGVLLPSVETASGLVQPGLVLTTRVMAERPFRGAYRRFYRNMPGDFGFGPAGGILPVRWGIRRIAVGAHIEITPVAAGGPTKVPGSDIGVSLAFSDGGFFDQTRSYAHDAAPSDGKEYAPLDIEHGIAQLDQLQTFINGYAHRPGTTGINRYADQQRWQ